MTKFKSVVSRTAGKLISWEEKPIGIIGKTAEVNFSICFYSDSIVRVTFTAENFFEDFSYAVTADPSSNIKLTVSEEPSLVILKSSTLQVHVSKNPVRLTFLTTEGQIINEDDALSTRWNGEQVATYKKLQEGERFIGLGEKTGPLDRKGQGYTNWNTDAYAYHTGADPLYCSTPFYIGLHNNLIYGIFLDNTHKTYFNFGASNNRFSSFAADSGEMNYYFMHGDSVGEIIKHYTHLTGRMEMPPLWSIGYQQCRYSYYPDKEVTTLAGTFRDKDIPADVIVFDIHYMDQYKIFTWSKKDFPDPKGLLKKLKELGFRVVVMCDPGIKVEEGYHTYEDGKSKDVFIKYPDGENYTGMVWPGWCHFPDFTNPKTRTWWKEQFKDYVNLGVEGFWNDMNEIATWGHSLPENIEMDFEGNKSTMRRGRNIYGFQMARSTYEGTKELMKGKRPFNLTRSAFSGIQRYSAVWTGDNVAYDEHMMLGVRLVNSMGLTGIAFAGYDVGGFVGNTDEKLFARWISIGAFSPFFRGHTMINTRDSEPWTFGERVEEISRNYIKLRYRLMPYLYSLFDDASKTGMPVNRSLAIDYPFDHHIYDHRFHNQYLFGPALLVAPVESNKDLVKVYLPEGNWYELLTDEQHTGNNIIVADCPLDKLPVYVKGSSIIPMREKAGSTVADRGDVLEIHLYKGERNNSFVWYEDDGETFAYQQGEFCTRKMEYLHAEGKFIIHAAEGKYLPAYKLITIFFHGFDGLQSLSLNGDSQFLQKKDYRFVQPMANYDPVNTMPDGPAVKNLPYLSSGYNQQQVVIQW
ncbi:MAG TPA: glycoside hydrolase family 31 protein [Cyclobacteriaceae bacterium]|nr:glycoside hydrolase family 31 protein [Cyclobacteriaceae bacterium]HRJ81640.1 glycoside hydrolase family 31 protein [Cyclobacteriaceae bacterium]